MAIDYTKAAQLAQRLITQNGRTITLLRYSETPTDPAQPWDGPTGNPTTLVVPAIQALPNQVRIFELSALGRGTEMEGLIPASELIYIVYAGETDLRQFSVVRDNSVDYSIQAFQEFKPGNVTILGYIGVRR